MKKLKLFFVGVLIALGSLLYAGDIDFSDTGMARFHYIDVEGSQDYNCIFRRGTTTRIEGAFSAPLYIDKLTLVCHLEIQGTLIPVNIPNQPAFQLPAKIGNTITFYLKLNIPNSYPSIQCIFHIKVRDGYGNEVAGAKFPVGIV